VLEYIYNDIGTPAQRNAILGEFYSPELKFFKEDAASNLSTVLENANAEKRREVLQYLKENILMIVSKGELMQHLSFAHHLIVEFFAHADDASRVELVGSLLEIVIYILHTRDGALAGLHCISYASPKVCSSRLSRSSRSRYSVGASSWFCVAPRNHSSPSNLNGALSPQQGAKLSVMV
jgi:pumilio family protein 6